MVDVEVAQWLRTLPVAPEYHPSEAEFVDPISYISKIEDEARQFGICKIVPPLPRAPKKTAFLNVNKSLQKNGNKPATLTTRRQQLGWNSKASKNHPLAHILVWQNGETHTLDEFETKAKTFARSLLGTCKEVPALGLETLFWKAVEDEPIFVEYAKDIPGSAFAETVHPDEKLDSGRFKVKEREVNPGWKLASSAWNVRHLTSSNGSLLKFMPEKLAGVTSPLLQIAMLYSWFGWQLEEHELHRVEYLHFGNSKTWYCIPPGAALALEELLRVHGYGVQLDAKEALTLLGEKTTIFSPEVLVSAGIPCCRVVQNAGEFVVTFPRAYHFGFSHGFSCVEAANFATPAWLKVATEAAYRRTLINKPPMLCHEQLLYESALSYSRRTEEIRSSRLKRNRSSEVIKEEFVRGIRTNYQLLQKLKRSGRTRSILLGAESENIADIDILANIDSIALLSFVCETMEGSSNTFSEARNSAVVNWGSTPCTACGVLCFSCILVVQPTPESGNTFLDAKGPSLVNEGTVEEQASAKWSDKDLQPFILCPLHALEISSYLQPFGGSRLLAVFHPDYQKFERNAKRFAKDMAIEDVTQIVFENGKPDDFTLINGACSAVGVGANWVARLSDSDSLNLFSKCDKKVVSNSSEEVTEEEGEEGAAKPLKEKKCWIVGRWCGRVWRYDQTSTFLGGSRDVVRSFKERSTEESRKHGLNGISQLSLVVPNFRKRKRTQLRLDREGRCVSSSFPPQNQCVADSCNAKAEAKSLFSSNETGQRSRVRGTDIEAPKSPELSSSEQVERKADAASVKASKSVELARIDKDLGWAVGENSSQADGSTLCHSDSVWHDVPILCTPIFDLQVCSFVGGMHLSKTQEERKRSATSRWIHRLEEDIFCGQQDEASTSSIQDLSTADNDDGTSGSPSPSSVHCTRRSNRSSMRSNRKSSNDMEASKEDQWRPHKRMRSRKGRATARPKEQEYYEDDGDES